MPSETDRNSTPDETSGQRSTVSNDGSQRSPLGVDCRYCLAGPTEPCRTGMGQDYREGQYHADRRRDAR